MPRNTLLALSACVAVAFVPISGCSPSPEPSGRSSTQLDQRPAKDTSDTSAPKLGGEIDVLCGGSFRGPMEELARRFEEETGIKALLNFGQSEDHLPQVKLKAGGDAFVSHDPYMDYTKDADALTRFVAVGYVAPVLVVAKGNPHEVKAVEDLGKQGLRVVLPNPEFSTCGEMVFALLDKKGIEQPVLANVGNAQVRSHSEVATLIRLKKRDAGIMWNGVAHNWLDDVEIVPTPYEYDDEIRVGVMGLSYSEKPELVERFLKFADEHGQKVFTEFGYVKN